MIYAYGKSVIGPYHVRKGIICQDAHQIAPYADTGDIRIAAVADGLGSEQYSDRASKIAASKTVEFCSQRIKADMSNEEIQAIIKDSFLQAKNAIFVKADEDGNELDQYDTTLSLAVYIKKTLHYGHSGDSGIVALTVDGMYESVTQQQRDEEGRVFPLDFESKWVFGTFDKEVSSVCLVTDGMYEALFPAFIHDEPVNIHVSLADYFMRNAELRDEASERASENKIKTFLEEDTGVDDDKTVVCLINAAYPPKPSSYPAQDMEALMLKYKTKVDDILYPSSNLNASGNMFFDSTGRKYVLGEKLPGSSEAATIHSTNYGVMAKIFRGVIDTSVLESKLKDMLAKKPDPALLSQIEWPRDILYDSNKRFRGYVLNECEGTYKLKLLYQEPLKQSVPLKQKLIIAQNMCSVLAEVHKMGYCVYPNLSNTKVNLKTGKVVFLDTDSYQMKNVDTTVLDNFNLAKHIFYLINGCDPFIDGKEKEGNYRFEPGKQVSAQAPSRDVLPSSIAHLFDRTFIEGSKNSPQIPSADEWKIPLQQYERNLVSCKKNPAHQYYNNLKSCPLCDAADTGDKTEKPVDAAKEGNPGSSGSKKVAEPPLAKALTTQTQDGGDGAESYYDHALKHYDHSKLTGTSLSDEEYKQVLAAFNKAETLGMKTNDKLYSFRGNVYFSRKKYPEAAIDYKEALKINPENKDAKEGQSSILSMEKN
jgi:serine/threonine protein phosphatase PrpC